MECPVCKKEFETHYQVLHHCKSCKDDAHKDYCKSSLKQDFVCKYCGKKFGIKGNLKTHLLRSKKCSVLYSQDCDKDILFDEKKEFTCKYCGKTGFNDLKGLATHRRFSKECFEKWKHEQDEIDSGKTKVKCEICGKYLRNISNTHLKTHGLTQEEYKERFPEANIFSEGLLEVQKERRESSIIKRYGNNREVHAVTKEKFIEKYGVEDGLKRWIELCKKHEHQCSLEYYCNKYGEEEGKRKYEERILTLKKYLTLEYYCNKYGEEEGKRRYEEAKLSFKGTGSLDYYCSKYGDEEGKQRYDEFCKKQSICRSLEKYIERYGKEKGTEIYNKINQKKKNTLKSFIERYGQEEGTRRWNAMLEKRVSFKQSGIALELFDELSKLIPDKKVYYYEHPKEFGVLIKEDNSYYMLDFYCLDDNKLIEFYGDYWHANPEIYHEDDCVFYPDNKSVLAKDIWKKDEERISKIKAQLNCEVLIVWQKDFSENRQETINKAIEFLKNQ